MKDGTPLVDRHSPAELFTIVSVFIGLATLAALLMALVGYTVWQVGQSVFSSGAVAAAVCQTRVGGDA